MKPTGSTVEEILASVAEPHRAAFHRLHEVMLTHLPPGFEAAVSYGGLGYVVPHRLYPAGYHCNPAEPLPFAGIASQKAGIHFYHMGLYADPEQLAWFQARYAETCRYKLDMGKSCVRFKRLDDIPFALIGELAGQTTPQAYIARYEAQMRPAPKTSRP